MNGSTLKGMACLLATGIAVVPALCSGSEIHTIPYPPSMEPVTFQVPDYARITNSTAILMPTGDTKIILTMAAAQPQTRIGRWALELFFASPYVPEPYTLGIVYLPEGGDAVSHTFSAGTAWLIDLRTQAVVSQISPQVSGATITFTLTMGQLAGSHLVWSASRYLPTELTELPIGVSLVSLRTHQQAGAPPRRPGRFPFPYELPRSKKPKPIPLPDSSPVTDPSRWRDVEDVNGDGRTDYDLEPDTSLGGDWLLGVWVIDLPFWHEEYAVYIGRDTNGNGRLDKDEIMYQVGQCPVPGGMDLGDVYLRPDGSFVIVWEVQQPQNNGPWTIRYVYDSSKPVNLRLWVYVQRGDGQPWELVWVGNPLTYPWEDRNERVGHDFPEPGTAPPPLASVFVFSECAIE